MFYWIYNVPAFFVWGLFITVFVGVCWLATILVRSIVERRLNQEGRLNEIMGDFLQYFGVIYGLLLGLLAVSLLNDLLQLERFPLSANS